MIDVNPVFERTEYNNLIVIQFTDIAMIKTY